MLLYKPSTSILFLCPHSEHVLLKGTLETLKKKGRALYRATYQKDDNSFATQKTWQTLLYFGVLIQLQDSFLQSLTMETE